MAAYNNQMMANALRRPDVAYPTGGGTVGRPMAQSLAMAPQPQALQQAKQPNLSELKQNAELMDKGMDKFRSWFGAGSGTGADIGAAAQQYGPEVAKMGGNVVGGGGASAAGGSGWMNGLRSMFGGGGGAGGGAGGLGALAAASHLVDQNMNENPNSAFNADRINNMGSVNGIGLRGGDLINGFNPATWASDPKKAAKGLGNAFTFGLMDKIF